MGPRDPQVPYWLARRSFNARDFASGAKQFGIRVVGPRPLLREIKREEG